MTTRAEGHARQVEFHWSGEIMEPIESLDSLHAIRETDIYVVTWGIPETD
jgi:hypothetical protein